MTGDERLPLPDGSPPAKPAAADSRAEQVLSQALRLMAGGGTPDKGAPDKGAPGGDGDGPPARAARRFTTGQLLLLAAIVGLLVGITVGLLSLL